MREIGKRTIQISRLAPMPANGGQSIDIPYGSTNDGTVVQQYASWNGTPQMFNLVADGSNWHIAMNVNTAKCLDLVGGGSNLGNGTQIAVNDCKSGDTSQDWSIAPTRRAAPSVSRTSSRGVARMNRATTPPVAFRCRSGTAPEERTRSCSCRPTR